MAQRLLIDLFFHSCLTAECKVKGINSLDLKVFCMQIYWRKDNFFATVKLRTL